MIPFIQTDPLPLIALKVNGVAANFIVDTGASETILDPDLAAKIGVNSVGSENGSFGGGKRSAYGLGRLHRLEIGDAKILDLPVQILATKAFSAAARGLPVGGVLGVGVLSHFRSTLDYPGGKLVLEQLSRRSKIPRTSVPMWLAGDHYILAQGNLGQGPTHLMLIDTGLAGAGFTGPLSTLSEAAIRPPQVNAAGTGGGGSVAIGVFEVPSLKLGPIERDALTGIFGAFPNSLEEGLSFHLAGIVSHQFFEPFALTFDFASMRLELRKQPHREGLSE